MEHIMAASLTTSFTRSAVTLDWNGIKVWYREWNARRREIARITRELDSMSNRELAELGLCRSDIYAVARGDQLGGYDRAA
jgi:uncharacterized protein YjiS (DUF1127 family)